MDSASIPNDEQFALEIKNLVRYYGDLVAVNDLSLQVRKGEVFGFLGPNGAGKTTSIRMMCGLLKPSSGEVYVNGLKIQEGSIHSRVGICPQHIVLWNKLTCYEQLVFMARMYDVKGDVARGRADTLISRIGLSEKRNKMASTLSGGMKRRMNVIMALVHDPEIVVFDEPEAGLDPQSRIMVREFIQETAMDKTVIFTTHNMDEAERVSDRVAIIDRGKLLKLDTPDRLKKSIGEGDILELSLKNFDEPALKRAEEKLMKEGWSIIGRDPQLVVKARDLVQKIPKVYSILESEGLLITQMQMRENTLEDVFIHLTGRGLRQ
ncbi:ABC transporter ATP-binding protein [Bacteroidota bacterium]